MKGSVNDIMDDEISREEFLFKSMPENEYNQFDTVMINAFNRILRDHDSYSTEDAYIILKKILKDRYEKFIINE